MAQRGGVVDDHDDVARGHRREVRGAQQRGARGRSATRQHDLLPRVPGAVRERRRRRDARVYGQPRAQLARPALHPAELGPRGGPRVDRDRSRSRRRRGHRRAQAQHPSRSVRFDSARMKRARPPPPPGRCPSAPPTSFPPDPPPGARGSACACSPARTARSSSRWRARATGCTGRGPTRPSARTSSTSSTAARAARTSSACWRCRIDDRRDRRRVHHLPDRPRRLPVRLPRLLRPRAPRRPGPDARGARAGARPLPSARSACTASRPTSSPATQPSIALARGAGFRLEGFSPRYLLIGGQWRDHERYAITADEHAAARAAASQAA